MGQLGGRRWRRFSDLTWQERHRRLDRMQGIAWVLIAATFLIVYGMVVVAVLESWKLPTN